MDSTSQDQGKVEIKRVCCFLCHVRCGLLATVENGRVVKLEGDPNNPHNKGYVCDRIKQDRWKDWQYSPYRIKRPRKRVGERGSGQWQEISWDQAFDEMADRLAKLRDKYGAETLAFTEGTYRTYNSLHYKFTNLFGSPNTGGAGTICYSSDMWLEPVTYGGFASDKSDWPNSNCIVLWGRNVAASECLLWDWVQTNRHERGAKLITVDPRFSEAARCADIHLQLKPATDTALALAWINVIINEKLYDEDFVKNYCIGFDELKTRASEWTPERAAEVTWVPAEKIIAAARMYATTKPACLPWGQKGSDALGFNSGDAIRAKAILRSITGNIDIEGGDKLSPPSKFPPAFFEHAALPQEQRDKMIGNERFPGLTFKGWDEISVAFPGFYPYSNAPLLFRAMATGDPYPVKALIVVANNPMVCFSNTKIVHEALKNLDTLIVHDYFPNPTTALADYVLPAATWLERPDVAYPTMDHEAVTFMASARVQQRFEGGHDVDYRDDYEFWYGLASRLGQGDSWWGPKAEGMLDFMVSPMGVNFEKFYSDIKYAVAPSIFQKYKKEGWHFLTPSGKVELSSTLLKKMGYDPLPQYYPPKISAESRPDLAEKFPLIMITGARFMPFYHSEHRQPGAFRNLHPDPIFDIHPETAMDLNIADGDWCWIETHMGRIKQRAKTTTIVDPRVVSVQHDWWFPEREEAEPSLYGLWQSSINTILDDDPETLDQLMGCWQQTGLMCRIYKVEDDN
ncbi:MAG: molybdopterin-dependent oxidoreductase [Anaerolineales bacterium]|nr:molybdopterin-dependent oxidoreductase [Anaerolineales bacterium]